MNEATETRALAHRPGPAHAVRIFAVDVRPGKGYTQAFEFLMIAITLQQGGLQAWQGDLTAAKRQPLIEHTAGFQLGDFIVIGCLRTQESTALNDIISAHRKTDLGVRRTDPLPGTGLRKT